MTQRVAAVVVSYNGGSETVRCVKSLRQLDAPVDIIVVDNGSTDGSRETVEQEFPDVEVIRAPRNLGYAGGNNVGFRRALELGADFVLVVNDDAEVVEPSFVSTLAERIQAHPAVGIAGPLVVLGDGKQQPTVARAPSFVEALRLTLARRLGRSPRLESAERIVPALNGVCLLIRRETLESTGGFDERYFMYGEEADFARRAELTGWKSLFVPIRSVVHHHPAGEVRGDAAMWIRTNFVRYCLEHRGESSAFATAALFWLAAAVRRDRRRLEHALREVLPSHGRGGLVLSTYEAVFVPVLVASLVVLLALGSSWILFLRHIGSAGKFAALGALACGLLVSLVLRPRSWLERLQSAWPVYAYASLFVLVAAASAAWSVSPRESVHFAVALALLLPASMLVPSAVKSRNDGTNPVIDALLVGLAVVVGLSLLVVAVDPSGAIQAATANTPRRFRGFLENPNTIATYAFLLPFAAWRVGSLGRRARIIALALGLVFAIEVLLSGTRLGVVLVAVVLLLYGATLLSRPRRTFGIAAAAILAAMVTLTIAAMFGLGENASWPSALRPSTIPTLSGRTEAWAAAGKMIHRRPLAGYGIGTEEQLLADYRATAERVALSCVDRFAASKAAATPCNDEASRRAQLTDFSGGYVHNSFFGLAMQIGVPTTIGWGIVLAAVFGIAIARLSRRGGLRAAAVAAVFGGLVLAFYETYLWNPGNVVAAPFWIAVGFALTPRVYVSEPAR